MPVSVRVLVAILLCVPATLSARRSIDKSVVTVNDDIILESDIAAFRQKIKSKNFQDLYGGIDPAKLESRDAIIQLLIEEKIMDQQVKKLELTASDQEVDRHIRTIVERNGITEAQLKSRLKDLGTSFQDYKEGIRRQLERRNLVDREIKPMMEVSDEEVRHFLQRSGGGEETSGHRYHLAHILITAKGKAGEERAKKVLAEALANPSQFAKIAKETSDDQATAETGGDLGQMTTDSMAKEFREAARKTPPGSVFGKPIRTAGGLHILKVLKSEPISFADLPEDRKTELRNQLMSQELEKKMSLWIERKKNEAHIRRSGQKEPNVSGS